MVQIIHFLEEFQIIHNIRLDFLNNTFLKYVIISHYIYIYIYIYDLEFNWF